MSQRAMNLLITGYYNKNNLGDDFFLEIAQILFRKYADKPYNLRFIGTDSILFTSQEYMNELINWCDKVILFGGEVLNNYFLNKLIKLKNMALFDFNKNIYFYAFGVSCNADYNEISNKLDIFEYIIYRNNRDYEYFIKKWTNIYSNVLPDIVFLKRRILDNKSTKKTIGFFLSQTVIGNATDPTPYINSIAKIVRFWLDKQFKIILFTMCNSVSAKENDLIINNLVYESLTNFEKNQVHFYDKPDIIISSMNSIDYAICWRFHAHILCITYEIPFISISNTPKVLNLLKDNDLEDLIYHNKNVINGCKWIINEQSIVKKKLSQIYSNLYNKVQEYKKWPIFLLKKRNLPRFYIDLNTYFDKIYNYIYLKFLLKCERDNHDYNATLILYIITGKLKTPYHWGLCEKFKNDNDIHKYKEDIRWIINEEMKEDNISFYMKMSELLNINNIIIPKCDQKSFINISYVDQNDMRGVHRSGWQYVIDAITANFANCSENAILCDLYLDRTFHWNYEISRKIGIIPYKKKWIGFIHHTTNIEYTDYNVMNMFEKPLFIESLYSCKMLITLSRYLQKKIKHILSIYKFNIPVIHLFHPTEFIDNSLHFNYNQFIIQPIKKIVQVGAWYRNIDAMYKLSLGQNPLKYERFALKGPKMDSYYSNEINNSNIISRDRTPRNISKPFLYAFEKPVTIINKLSNEDYDNLFKTSIIFIELIDVSAANTIIESIVRNTPILINKLEAVVEYLGPSYPFYYSDYTEARNKANSPEIIKQTHKYLKNMDKRFLTIEYFLKNFNDVCKKYT